MMRIAFTCNSKPVEIEIEEHQRLIDVLRDRLGLYGTKEGCGQGECGACTVIVDGRAVNSCLYPAPEIEGKSVLTIEGLKQPDNRLSTLQRSFVEHGGIQCGFCTPGMIMSARALLDQNSHPGEEEIREALTGNLCRCTGYVQIVDSIKHASSEDEKDGS